MSLSLPQVFQRRALWVHTFRCTREEQDIDYTQEFITLAECVINLRCYWGLATYMCVNVHGLLMVLSLSYTQLEQDQSSILIPPEVFNISKYGED